MNSFKEWMVKSILVRAIHRDGKMHMLREHYRQTRCGGCEKFMNPDCREFECNAISYCCIFCKTRFCTECDQMATFDGTTDCICEKCTKRPDVCQKCVEEDHVDRYIRICPNHKYVNLCDECDICLFCKHKSRPPV